MSNRQVDHIFIRFVTDRSLLENAGAVLGERTLQWDMSRLHPGLQLRVGPSISGGLMEFVVDPSTQYDERSQVHYQEESTGKHDKAFAVR